MNSRILGWIVAAAAVAGLIFVLLSREENRGENGFGDAAAVGTTPSGECASSAGSGRTAPDARNPPAETLTGTSVTKDDVGRLPSDTRDMKGLIEMTGTGARLENGYEVSCSFYYVTEVAYKSRVKERSVTPGGEVRVVETRRYDQCNDRVTVGDFDAKLCLSVLPIEQIAPYVAGIAEVVGACYGVPQGAGTKVVEEGVKALLSMDGISVKQMLSLVTGLFGEEVPKDAAEWVERITQPEAKRVYADIKQAAQEISGREYIVTYYQSASGSPMRIRFERADKTPLSMQEYRILREMNVFLGSRVVPTRCPAVGESWEIDVGELPGAFDSLSGGNNVEGKLKATRAKDRPDGSMHVDIAGGRIAVLDDVGMEAGSFMIDKGEFLATARNGQVIAFEMLGKGKLRVEEVKKRFLVFDMLTRTSGDCNVRVMLTSADAE